MSDEHSKLHKLISDVVDDPNLRNVFVMFSMFSRWEYALKRIPKYTYVFGKDLRADWKAFGKLNNDTFVSGRNHENSVAVNFFLANPPKIQVLNDGCLGWSNAKTYDASEPLLEWLLDCVKRVRNNLFHGGKFPSSPISDPSRDLNLIMHSIEILESCFLIDEEVARYLVENF